MGIFNRVLKDKWLWRFADERQSLEEGDWDEV